MEKGRRSDHALSEALRVREGVTAVIGAGGKTSLLRALGRELRGEGARVILCTTTRIRAFQDIPGGDLKDIADVRAALAASGLIWVGTEAESGKWAAPRQPLRELARVCDFLIAEADGSAGLPFKAHRSFEPVIPDEANQTILVAGATGFFRAVDNAAHCPDLFAQRAGCTLQSPVTPRILARVLRAENLHDQLLINQAETDQHFRAAAELQGALQCEVCAGALFDGKGDSAVCLL